MSAGPYRWIGWTTTGCVGLLAPSRIVVLSRSANGWSS
jgi:hypothetical protein